MGLVMLQQHALPCPCSIIQRGGKRPGESAGRHGMGNVPRAARAQHDQGAGRQSSSGFCDAQDLAGRGTQRLTTAATIWSPTHWA